MSSSQDGGLGCGYMVNRMEWTVTSFEMLTVSVIWQDIANTCSTKAWILEWVREDKVRNWRLETNFETWRAIFQRFFFVWKLVENKMFRQNFGKVESFLLKGSSDLNTFPENVVIFFAQIIIYHMLITGNKKLCGVFGWNIALEWGRKWALKRKNSRKTSLFFSSLAKSAMNWCLVAVFFSLVLGSSVRKTSGRHSRDCLEEYRGFFVIN